MFLKRLTIVLLLFSILIFLNCGKGSEKKNPDSGFNFSLPDLKGKTHSLKEFRRKFVLLNFWATWCPSCKEDLNNLLITFREYKDSGLEIVAISLDKNGLGVDSFVKELNLPYIILLGDENVVKNFGGFKGLPTSFLIDKQGRIVKRYSGQINPDSLRSDLRTWIGK